jgi:hypothetical protein
MKFSLAVGCALFVSQASAFSVAPMSNSMMQANTQTQLHMFSGGGAGAAPEDNEEEMAKVEASATAMGMSVSEYQLAMNARTQLAATLDNTTVKAGKKGEVFVEKDLNGPPKNLQITITEEGKALGKDVVSKELVKALKATSEEAKIGRAEAQKSMMTWIQDQLKQ